MDYQVNRFDRVGELRWWQGVMVGLFVLVLVVPVWSQVGPQWNRKVTAISVVPETNEPNIYHIRGYFLVDANDIGGEVNLSTVMEIRVNGVVVDQQIFRVLVSPAGRSSPCGTCDFFDICSCGTNPNTGVFSCQCGSFFTFGGHTEPLQPGDEIMVILYPAPGALPDQPGKTGDDLMMQTFRERPIFWQRHLKSVDVQPSSVGDSFFDITVDVEVFANFDGLLEIKSELEVLVDGVSYTTVPVITPDEILWSQCEGPCNGADCALQGTLTIGSCSFFPDLWLDCACKLTTIPQVLIPAVPSPGGGGDLEIILRPVPGALPELPPLPGCGDHLLADLDWDCDVDLVDFSLFAGLWLQCNHFNPSKCFGGS